MKSIKFQFEGAFPITEDEIVFLAAQHDDKYVWDYLTRRAGYHISHRLQDITFDQLDPDVAEDLGLY